MDSNALISGNELKAAAGQYLARIQEQAVRREGLGIFDKWFLRVVGDLSSLDPEKPWEESLAQEIVKTPAKARGMEWDFLRLRQFLDRWRQGRYVDYAQREKSSVNYSAKYGGEFGSDVLLTAQGAPFFMQWRGLPLMKTVFDFALYPQLLEEIRPRTVFEIGSGAGASALWLADHLALLGVESHVHSVDIAPVAAAHPGVTFHHGDCTVPKTLFPSELLRSAPHPWLVIEDAHQNVEAVLNAHHSYLQAGDYLYVEDSEIKRGDLKGFLGAHPGAYRVDTKYTDFFGRNATCAIDSIFVRQAD